MGNTISPHTVARLRRRELIGWGLGILLLLFGFGAAVFPTFSFGHSRTEGTVVRHHPKVVAAVIPDPHRGPVPQRVETFTVSYPVVEYQVGDRKYLYRTRSAMQSYPVGQKLPVLYRDSRPEMARLDTFADRWFVPLTLASMLVVVGAFVTVVTAILRSIRRTIETALREEGERRT